MKLQKIKRFDRLFGCGYTESQDSSMNYEKYQDELKKLIDISSKIAGRLNKP